MPGGLSELFLDISYVGDVGRLYEGRRLLDDNFYNRLTWKIWLNRFLTETVPKDLTLEILPLRRDASIYLPASARPAFLHKLQISEIQSVHACPEYEVALTLAGKVTR